MVRGACCKINDWVVPSAYLKPQFQGRKSWEGCRDFLASSLVEKTCPERASEKQAEIEKDTLCLFLACTCMPSGK